MAYSRAITNQMSESRKNALFLVERGVTVELYVQTVHKDKKMKIYLA